MKFYAKIPVFRDSELFRKTERRFWEYAWKLLILQIIMPIWATAASVLLWYFVLYRNHIYVSPEVRETINAAWIPTFGVLYALIATLLFGFAFNKYVEIRCAINACEFHDFMKWRKENISPAFHAVMTTVALGVLGGFACLPYDNWYTGALLVGGATYVFALFFWVIREVDDPFRGIWVIRYIQPDWLDVDQHLYRAKQLEAKREVWAAYLADKEEEEQTTSMAA